jgi:hypothetical protein
MNHSRKKNNDATPIHRDATFCVSTSAQIDKIHRPAGYYFSAYDISSTSHRSTYFAKMQPRRLRRPLLRIQRRRRPRRRPSCDLRRGERVQTSGGENRVLLYAVFGGINLYSSNHFSPRSEGKSDDFQHMIT